MHDIYDLDELVEPVNAYEEFIKYLDKPSQCVVHLARRGKDIKVKSRRRACDIVAALDDGSWWEDATR
jgi:hypothetical protein